MIKWLGAIFFAILCINGFANEPPYCSHSPKENSPPAPWLTGPLLTPSGHVVPKNYVNAEPYFFYTVNTGRYNDDWQAVSTPHFTTANFQFPLYLGITQWMDILIDPSASWNHTEHVSNLVFNDFIVELDFQVIEDTQKNQLPGLKIYVQETFPTGPYEKRDGGKLGTDLGGGGSFVTTFGFVITHLFHIYDVHWLSLRFNGLYKLPTHVSVKGINAYGGAPNTDGKVRPGDTFSGLFGAEYTLTQNWALAFDAVASYSFSTKFSGNPGTLPDGSPAIVGSPPSFNFSIAPAFEYNFSESFGIIAGAWFTLKGRNSSRFASGVIAINYFGPLPKAPRNVYRSSGGGASP